MLNNDRKKSHKPQNVFKLIIIIYFFFTFFNATITSFSSHASFYTEKTQNSGN